MLPQPVQDALNDQIRDEFYASYLYLAVSAYFESLNLGGFARWMRVQSEEEQEHAMKIFDFIHERGGQVVLRAIDQPPASFESPLAAFEAAYAHEQRVTQSIHNIYGLAGREQDYATQVMLEWFIAEQVEEEKITGAVVHRLKMVADHPAGLFMMDSQLGARSE